MGILHHRNAYISLKSSEKIIWGVNMNYVDNLGVDPRDVQRYLDFAGDLSPPALYREVPVLRTNEDAINALFKAAQNGPCTEYRRNSAIIGVAQHALRGENPSGVIDSIRDAIPDKSGYPNGVGAQAEEMAKMAGFLIASDGRVGLYDSEGPEPVPVPVPII